MFVSTVMITKWYGSTTEEQIKGRPVKWRRIRSSTVKKKCEKVNILEEDDAERN